MLIPWPEYPPDLPSERGWQPSLKRAAIPILRKSKLVLHVGAIRGETTRDILSSFDGMVIATDPLWPNGFHSTRHFFSTCWKFSDRAVAWAGDPMDFLDWVSSVGDKPDAIVINGDIGERYPSMISRIVELFGHIPICGTEVAKMDRFLRPIYPDFERFDGFSWRASVDLMGAKWACPADSLCPEGDWFLAIPSEAAILLEKGNVVFFCRTFGMVPLPDLNRWYDEFMGSNYDASVSSCGCFMAKGKKMSKAAKDGWVEDITTRCYDADVLLHIRI